MTLIRKSCQLASCTLLAVLAIGLVSGAQAQGRYTVSADGQEVLDAQSRLTWRRCAEGMGWDGKTCAGKPTKLTYSAARKQVANFAASTGVAWRVPTKDELLSLVDKTQKRPLIDHSAFPATPRAMFWSTRPETDDNLNAWIVNFSNGRVYGNTGTKAPHLRLVRSAS